jgi:hypothetical protein
MPASFARSLESYKQQQRKVAEDKGVLERLMRATTLTEARKIVYGAKTKKATHLGGK